MRGLMLFAAIITLNLAVPCASAQHGGAVVEKKPGAVSAARTIAVTATITAIDAKTREITLKGPEGHEVTVEAGPKVKNFAQMKVGDHVHVRYVEALAIGLRKGGGQPVAVTEHADEAGAKQGEMPKGVGGRKVTVVADVTAVDPKTQTITLRGPQNTIDMKVRDPEQFKLIAKGDQIEATYSEALAVAVERVKDGKAKQ